MPTQYFGRILLFSDFLMISSSCVSRPDPGERPRPHDGGVQERLVKYCMIPAVTRAQPLQRHSVHRIRSHVAGWQQNYAREPEKGHRA